MSEIHKTLEAPRPREPEPEQEPRDASAADNSTFAPGLRILPREVRPDTYLLYRVLRTLDDLVDYGQPQAEGRIEAVERWSRGEAADTPETRALTDLSRRHVLPREAFLDFCSGMRHDLDQAVVHTEDDLELYCQQAGGSVGIMLARILGTSSPDGEERMATLGRAMQRTNILRDIDEDYTHGRVYVARSTIARFGWPTPGGRAALLEDQIALADVLYDQATEATSMLVHGQRGMALCTTLYREILRQIEREGYGQRRGRVEVPLWRRNMLIAEHHLGLRWRSVMMAPARP
jgi:phytoene synthase